jgi:methionine aminopeptidase
VVERKTRAEIEAMAEAGAVVAEALRAVVEHAQPGRSTTDLDKVAATASGARAAHRKHTVAVTADGARILTN